MRLVSTFITVYGAAIICVLIGPVSGKRTIEFRIVNGTAVTIATYPFVVSVQKWTPFSKQHICGGTLISEIWVLTAAHCVDKVTPQTVMVRANSSFYNRGGQLHRVQRVLKHENFTYLTGDYDFGLLQLLQQYRRAMAVKLPSGRRRYPPTEPCTAMGWGYTMGPESREQLRQVVLPIVSQKVCRKAYAETDEITARMLCAGYAEGGRDSCDGDSGGPLFCRGIQTGIISWAIGCAEPNKYGVYSNVAEGREWIRKKPEFSNEGLMNDEHNKK